MQNEGNYVKMIGSLFLNRCGMHGGRLEALMRRVVCALVLFGSLLNASPVENPASPQLIRQGFFIPCDSWLGIRVGYEGDFVSDARMNQTTGGSGRVDNYTQNTNSGTATFTVVDRLDVYGVFGSSRMEADWRYSSAGTINRAQIQSKYRFLWGVGARGILYEWGCAVLGVGGRYSSSTPKPSWLAINGTPVSVSGGRVHWREWQIDLDLAYKIELFTPYVGIKYSNALAKLSSFPEAIANNGSHSLHMQNRSPVGIVVGCTLSTGKYFMFNVEGRLIDEEAATVSGDLRF